MLGANQQSNDWEGRVLYDGDCGFCARWVEFWRPTLERRRITIAALQEPWVAERLRLPPNFSLTPLGLPHLQTGSCGERHQG